MFDITAFAIRALEEDSCLFETAEECLSFLEDDSHFKNISKELTEVLHETCGISGEEKALINELCSRIMDLEYPDGYSKDAFKNKRKTVERWFTKNKVPGRPYAIKICFALGLGYKEAVQFLRKGCKSYGFNVRSAEEAVYMFCLLNGKSYQEAEELLRQYRELDAKAESSKMKEASPEKESTDSHTTRFLIDSLKSGKCNDKTWEDSESFLQNYLLPNRIRFTNYAKTATRFYYDLKEELQVNVISDNLDVDILNSEIGREEKKSCLLSLMEILQRYSASYEDIDKLYNSLANDFSSATTVWKDFVSILSDTKHPLFEKKNTLLNKLMPLEDLLRNILCDVPYDWSKFSYEKGKKGGEVTVKSDRDFASYKRSLLKDLVQGILLKNTFEDFEDAPELNTYTASSRKIIILMFYLNYVYDWKHKKTEKEKSYNLFFDELTDMLDDCQFACLYHADPFDWLILRSIREWEKNMKKKGKKEKEENEGKEESEETEEEVKEKEESEEDEEEDEAEDFFFQVLTLSFDYSDTERYLSRYIALYKSLLLFPKDSLKRLEEEVRGLSKSSLAFPSSSASSSTLPSASQVNTDLVSYAKKELERLYKESRHLIESLSDPEERFVLFSKYLDGLDYGSIAIKMKKSHSDIVELHLAALEKLSLP